MTQYLISVWHGDDYAPPEDEMQQIFKDVDVLNAEIQQKGAWVFGGGLHPAHTATVLQLTGGDVVTTDGPYAESKEHIGGFWVIEAEDLDAALEWGRKAAVACRIPVEVRPFQDEPS